MHKLQFGIDAPPPARSAERPLEPGSWRWQARRVIAAALADAQRQGLTAEQTCHLIDARYPFGIRARHPYRMWLTERKRAIDGLGLASTAAQGSVRPAAAHPPDRLITIPPNTPCFLEVMLLLHTACNVDGDERDRVLNCACNIIRNHWPLDWHAALIREGVPRTIQQVIVPDVHPPP